MLGQALFGTLLSGFGSALSNQFNQQLQNDAQRWQTSERVASQKWNEQMWQANNSYNEGIYNQYLSPVAQIRQQREAGINPLSGYSANQNVLGSSNPSASASTPSSVSPPYIDNFVNPSTILAVAQAKNLEADTASKEIENYIASASKNEKLVSLFNEYAIKGWQKAQEQNKAIASEELWNQIYLGNELLRKKIDTEDSTSRIAAITAMFHQEDMIAKINDLNASYKLKDQEYKIKDMTKWLSEQFGVDPGAGDMYNVASLLLNPTARKNLLENLGLDSILSFFK